MRYMCREDLGESLAREHVSSSAMTTTWEEPCRARPEGEGKGEMADTERKAASRSSYSNQDCHRRLKEAMREQPHSNQMTNSTRMGSLQIHCSQLLSGLHLQIADATAHASE